MKNSFLSFMLFVLTGCPMVFGQVIDLDKEPTEVLHETFEKSTMFYLSPVSSFSYNFGYRNMRHTLNSEFDLKQRRFGEFIGAGIALRKRQMFYNFFMALPPFSSMVRVQDRNVITIADSQDVYFDFTVGNAVVANDRYYVILRAGAGIQGRSLQLRQVDRGSFDFNDLPSNPQNTAWPQLEHLSGTWDVAVEYMPRAFRRLSVMESVQLGYKGGIGGPRWRSSEMNLQNSFPDRVSVLYFRVMIVISRER